MKAQRCFQDERLVTFCLDLLGCYAEIWVWREVGKLECVLGFPNTFALLKRLRRH
jgi:hypothetical protein